MAAAPAAAEAAAVAPSTSAPDAPLALRVRPVWYEDRRFKAKEWSASYRPSELAGVVVAAYERAARTVPSGNVGTQWYYRGRRLRLEASLADNKVTDGALLACCYLRKARPPAAALDGSGGGGAGRARCRLPAAPPLAH